MGSVTAMLADAATTSTIQDAFSTAINSIKGDVMGMVGTALPVALAIVGVFIAVRLGIKFFKSASK